MNDYRTWKLQVKPFAERYYVITYSRRYHYPNKWANSSALYSAIHEADDMKLFLEALGLKKVHLIGSSYGAYSILFFVLQFSNMVNSIVLGEPPIVPWLLDIKNGKPHYDRFIYKGWEPAIEAFKSGNMEEGVRLFINGVSGEGYYESLSPKARKSLMDNAPELKLEALSDGIFPELKCEDLKKISIPVLLLQGENSPEMFHLITNRLNNCIPNSRLEIIPNASHGMHIQNPDYYNNAVLNFLKLK